MLVLGEFLSKGVSGEPKGAGRVADIALILGQHVIEQRPLDCLDHHIVEGMGPLAVQGFEVLVEGPTNGLVDAGVLGPRRLAGILTHSDN